jgi:hexulose-6-phosphate isomerase
MARLQDQTGVKVRSLVADYYMERLLVSDPAAEADLRRLIVRCAIAGIGRIVLPFVDASSLANASRMSDGVAVVQQAIVTADEYGVELHLETDLPPRAFSKFLTDLDHQLVRVNYDSGNSASLGFDVQEEFAAYGHRIGSVHLKDRVRGGTTVPLGEGDADFPTLFSALSAVGYSGDLILQVARGTSGDEVAWAAANSRFFEPYVKQLLT